MKIFKKLLLIILLFLSIFLCNMKIVRAEEKNNVNIYLFYSSTCPVCHKEKVFLDELKNNYDNVYIYEYEISMEESREALILVNNLFGKSVNSVPYTIIGNKEFAGYNDNNIKESMINYIDYFSLNGYEDKLGTLLKVETLPTYDISLKSFEEFLNETNRKNNEYVLNIPLMGEVNLKNMALPVISILIGLIDGFNPCAMWVLLFLISMLMGMNDRKKMWILGLTFLITSALIYLCFMMAWLSFATYVNSIIILRVIIGLIAIVGGSFNITSYFKKKDDGCEVVSDKKRTKIFDRIRKIVSEKNLLFAIFGIILLAVSVNIIELACSAGLPVMFTNILSLNNLSTFEYAFYMFLYILFFLIDDLIIFFIAMISMKLTGISTKYGKISHLVGGIILALIGIMMIFKPEWLMFHFN